MSKNRSDIPNVISCHVLVTQEDIDEATRRRSAGCDVAFNCPVALALGRIFDVPKVDYCYFSGFIANRKYAIELPCAAIDFIRRFDGDEPCEPIEFDCMAVLEAVVLT